MKTYFEFDKHRTTYKQETLAGLATFLTMAYIIIVNPAILEAAGIPKGPSMTATILAAAFGTLIMGLYAKRPFAIAPYMGENAFIAFTVVKVLGCPWQTALGAIFIAGVLFTLLTVFKVRGWLADTLPQSLKYSFSVGIGLFLTFIGLNETGVVVLGVPGRAGEPREAVPAHGAARRARVLHHHLAHDQEGPGRDHHRHPRDHRAVVYPADVTPMPASWVSLPPGLGPIALQLDIAGALSLKNLPIVLIIFVMAFVDTVGTLIGLSARGGLLDEKGNLPEIEKPMLADAVANLIAPMLGHHDHGGLHRIRRGDHRGRPDGLHGARGLGALPARALLRPILTAVPPHAYGTALIVIGIFMISPLTKIDFSDYTELVPAFLTIVLMIFTYNIGVGMTAGLLAYPLLKTVNGRFREVPAGMWVFAALSLVFYIFYPYR